MKNPASAIIFLLMMMSGCAAPQSDRSAHGSVSVPSFVPPMNTARMRLFDTDWKFFKGETADGEAPSTDDSQWRKTDLPHDWSIEDLPGQKPGEIVGPFDKNSIGVFYTGYTDGGTGWYRKTFITGKADQDKNLSIYFDGVYMESDVWLNGHHLGSHRHGYTPFFYDLGSFLNPPGQKNTIAVHVKNIGENSRWYSGSGIYRHVWLRVTDKLNIPVWGVYITTPGVSAEKAMVSAIVSIENGSGAAREFTLRNTVLSPLGKEVMKAEKSGKVEQGEKTEAVQSLEIGKPCLWSVETPDLYTLRSELISDGKILDTEETTFGIRNISFTPHDGFLLNGKKVILRGACIHHDNGSLGSAAFDRADQRRIENLKAAGFNAIRTSHNPPSQGFLDACDRAGMLVLDEAFDMWQNPKRPDDYHLFFREWHDMDLRSMILRDRNHPSIIMWSIGNEISERADSSGLRIAKELKGTIKELDSTRPVTEAICEFWETKGRPWDDSAPAFANLDVCGYNYVYGEYGKDHARFPERVIAGTESFALDIYGNWKMATENPYVIGDFVWTGMDYLGEAGIGQAMTDSTTMCWPWIISNCGDLDITGFKKPQAFYRDVVWDRSKLEIAVEEIPPAGKKWLIRAWGWPRELQSWTWPGNDGKNMTVRVYTKCDEVRLELNGKAIATQKTEPGSKFTCTFNVPYEPGVLKAIALSDGKVMAEKSLVTSGPPVGIRITADRQSVTTNRNDLAYLTVELTDAEGRIAGDASRVVRFHVDGEAGLMAVDNGNPMEPKSFRCDSCITYHGRCLAILRPAGTSGKVLLTATCGELRPGKCTVELK